ncbi:MAG: ABC transporter permease [Dermatophilaceae bacterium]|nr:ABC transporter permease [Intrasporangiaceae bacterium]
MSAPGTTAAPPLRPVLARAPLGRYLRSLWQRRHFILADSRARAFSGNRDMVLGNLWLVGRPLLEGAVYYIIFGLLLKTSRGIDNFTGFLLIGVFLFSYTARCVTRGVASMAAARNLIQSFAFPRAAIPLAVLLREAWSMLPVLGTLVVLLVVVPPGTTVTATWLLFPVVFILHTLFNTGVVLYAARLGATTPDLKYLLTYGVRLWFYGSGVMFSVDRFVSHPFWLAVLKANPLYLVLEISRDLLLYDTVSPGRDWLILGAWAVVTASLGFAYFWQGETGYAQD